MEECDCPISVAKTKVKFCQLCLLTLHAAFMGLMLDDTDFQQILKNEKFYYLFLTSCPLHIEYRTVITELEVSRRGEDALKLKSRPNLNTLFTILAICSSAVQQLLFKAYIPAIIE